ncbi:MAG: FG-GAP repeat protein [Planctomycetes bacterium]|nr:FG-GAP repeat protein [Planctomycetota bacterium]
MKPFSPVGLLGLVSAITLVVPANSQVAGGGFDKRFSWYGTADGDLLGHAVAGVGDVNGDGYGDVLLGAPGVNGLGGELTPDHGLAVVRSGLNGSIIYSYSGSSDKDKVGTGVTGVGDVDGDTIPDFAISSDANGGEVIVYSGLDGLAILTISAPAGSTRFGEHLAAPGDVNADGIPDLLASGPGSEFGGVTEVGAVYLMSGADGSLIRSHGGVAQFDNFGRQICCPGDMDGDGISEIVATATGANPNGLDGAGSVFVYSGATGGQLHQFDGAAKYDFFGWSVASPGDLDGDNFADLLVGSIFENYNGRGEVGIVYIYSGATGALIRIHGGSEGSELFGAAVCGIGDMNEDGVPDYAVGSDGTAFGGQVTLWSGANSSVLYKCESETWNEHYGNELMSVGDLDGNGKTEFMVGAHSTNLTGTAGGAAYLYEYKDFMSVSHNTISASQGAVITVDFDFPVDWIYEPKLKYHLLMNTSGITYGSLYGYPNPLINDYLYSRTLSGYYPPSFLDASGQLDADGDGSAKIFLNSDDANPYLGLSFYFACLFYEEPTLANAIFRGFSRPAMVTIIN